MWMVGRHRHFGTDVLSEFIDGRLSGRQLQRVSSQLNSCDSCRGEAAELRATVSLLQDLPDLAVPRSFALAAPPVQIVRARAADTFRMPNWAYASAASVAALALAVIVSADATGLLEPSAESQQSVAFGVHEAPSESTAPAKAVESTPSAAPEIAVAPQQEAMQALRAMERAAGAAEAEADRPANLPEAAPAPAAMPESNAFLATVPQTPGPEDAVSAGGEDAAPADLEGLAVSPESMDGPTATDFTARKSSGPESSSETEALTADVNPERRATPVPEQTASQPDSARESPIVEGAGTPLIWRVLEGVTAAIALALLSMLALRWRRSRQAD